MSLDSSLNASTPRTELPSLFSRGENVATPNWPGSVPNRPPETPDFAGIPTSAIHRPAPSYMPAELITDSVNRHTSASKILSPVTGCTPPFANVADITARSRTVTTIEHCSI